MTDLKKMLLGVGSLSMAGSVTAQQAPASEKGEVPTPPNILFLVVDDLKPNIGPYGDPIARTPAFDRIAASGVTFMNNYCQFPRQRSHRTAARSYGSMDARRHFPAQ